MENESLFRDRYRILRKLGEGGSSAVYMALDNVTCEPVTIKLMKSDVFGGIVAKDIVAEEAGMLRALKHDAIPGVVDVYDDAFVLEYIPGNTLEKVIKTRGKLREKEAVRIAKELLQILEYLHGLENPVIYRDLKPSNIIIKPDGHVALIDFGAARVYRRGDEADTMNLGTFGYAAPEQFGSLGQTDPRTDIYCLGRTMEQIIKGRITPELAMIIDKCTRPDREDRLGSCREISEELSKYPAQVMKRNLFYNAKIAFLAAAAALVISFTMNNYESIRSYAASDMEVRMPAVKERFGNAGLWIQDKLEEKFGIEVKMGLEPEAEAGTELTVTAG